MWKKWVCEIQIEYENCDLSAAEHTLTHTPRGEFDQKQQTKIHFSSARLCGARRAHLCPVKAIVFNHRAYVLLFSFQFGFYVATMNPFLQFFFFFCRRLSPSLPFCCHFFFIFGIANRNRFGQIFPLFWSYYSRRCMFLLVSHLNADKRKHNYQKNLLFFVICDASVRHCRTLNAERSFHNTCVLKPMFVLGLDMRNTR